MRWPWKKKPAPATNKQYVDLDRDVIPLGDDDDPTSLMFTLAMEGEPMMMDYDGDKDEWVVYMGKRKFRGKTQMEALRKASGDDRVS